MNLDAQVVQNFDFCEPVKFSDLMTKFAHSLPADSLEYIRKRVSEIIPTFCLGSFKLRVVIDTNILYQCVRGRMLDGSCFLDKVGESPVLELCAPPELEEEIYEKIEVKFPKDKKTRDLDLLQCKTIAEELLQMVKIERDPKAEYLEQAKKVMSTRDKDDAPFLALYLSTGAHGIVTMDKDLKEQDNVRTFGLKDIGKIITVVNRGALSLFASCSTVPALVQVVYELLCAVISGFVAGGRSICRAIAIGAQKGLELMSGWHPFVQIAAALGLVTVECKTGLIRQSAEAILRVVVVAIKALADLIKDFASLAEESLPYLIEMLRYVGEALVEIEGFNRQEQPNLTSSL